MSKFTCAVLIAFFFSLSSQAAVEIRSVPYHDGKIELEGFVANDPSIKGPKPGILVVHEWDGPGAYVRMRIQKLAELGYIAFAADIYGKNLRPKTLAAMGEAAGSFKKDRPLLKKRMQLALEEFKKMPQVNPDKLVAIGYCFGGTAALELARSGARLKGFVSFHGGLDTPKPEEAKNIKGQILVFHGAADPNVKPAEVNAFEKEMSDAGIKYELVKFGGVVHKFTNPDAGSDVASGAAYDRDADQKSWDEFKLFLTREFQ